jgi:hypothetical protein
MAAVLWVGGYALHEDLTSDGLRRTQAFFLLGLLIYPLFYGACAWMMFYFASLFRRRHEFLTIANDTIEIGRRSVPVGDVRSIEVRRAILGPKLLVMHRNEGPDIKLAAFVLTRPIDTVAAELNAALAHSNSTMI